MKLMNKELLPCHQIVPYAPLEMRKTDLETEPVRSMLDHLKETGVLALEGGLVGSSTIAFRVISTT